MRVGVLTGGGDCPGLNAVIRSVVRKGVQDHDWQFVGIVDGWRGAVEDVTTVLDVPRVRGILTHGGTILGASRTNPLRAEDGVERVRRTLGNHGIDALVVIGGEDTLGVAQTLAEQGIDLVGVPKTIDNDVGGTDYTFGFDTAVSIAAEAIDRLHTTAESHRRALVVEVMGRHAGWIALHAGVAGGASGILVPERAFDVEEVCAWVERRFRLRYAPVVVVAEGAVPQAGQLVVRNEARDEFGHVRLSGIGDWLAGEIERRTGRQARTTVLGYLQRGGTPTAYDRWLATRFGLAAVAALKDRDFGTMTALRGTDIIRVPLADALRTAKQVPAELYEEFTVFFGS
ncbi:pyrophosphate--fructose 6-phosphate 1-phosphotransferase [Streptomyces sulfonofaciens]|uniref:Pyrophosphate--fructose 6-phosphate 1-phosphotransferase n=1 Tax=Streptomyces sulfonofaciens TaxID=68272 RepID=A0A919G2W0_9ACTN|nr:6-phosphofructokinase [Streptomyces sulfonofaciens]GHH76649.1 pyrophosphate--fructose 6-phosphate 1-phosphotransferase [Streptomyces sulfonofaciens]